MLNDDELTLRFSDVDGLLGRAVLVLFTGLPAAVALWLLFLSVNQLRIMAGIAFLAVVLSFGLVAVRFAVLVGQAIRRGSRSDASLAAAIPGLLAPTAGS
ncbi:hypothetical protein [Mycolicibacterium sphagni]|uniref:Uncharacterized protein n=1 Tax=Mycolicibacterium sphagni TaxID=1786 RepID=A0ABX2JYX4_9MYCO|nr:hypothetical protein [Mycolicibacterium sphagni]NTY62946.1 hypothetical protein [Mycolicibacterium sphagni]